MKHIFIRNEMDFLKRELQQYTSFTDKQKQFYVIEIKISLGEKALYVVFYQSLAKEN